MQFEPIVVGHGDIVSGGSFEGRLASASTRDEVIELVGRDDLAELVLLVDSPSATALVPLMSSIRGVICLGGGPTSHLALVAREFGLPCVMAAQIEDARSHVGRVVVVREDGQIESA